MSTAILKTSPELPAKRSFRQQMHIAREDAIVAAVNRLLAEKGFEAMTVDEVAAEVGIAKASLYKHFPSKEDLAAAAMVRVMERARAFLDSLDVQRPPLELLRSVARWTMEVQLAGEMPSLPSENSSLRTALTTNKAYVDGLMDVSDRLGGWITGAAADRGALHAVCPRLRPGAGFSQRLGPVQRHADHRPGPEHLLRRFEEEITPPAPRLAASPPPRGRCEWPGEAGSTASWVNACHAGGGVGFRAPRNRLCRAASAAPWGVTPQAARGGGFTESRSPAHRSAPAPAWPRSP